ncbi:MAG: biotin/lipoate A/B protein ligase family protein [Anaerolineae bacterium]
MAVAAGRSLPTLRLYAWEPACLSLGYGQPWQDADVERISARGWDIVRRATGGRAILHTNELTYSLTLPADHPLAQGSILESYRRISRALVAGLEKLHLQPQADKRAEKVQANGAVCFEVPSHYEITTQEGRKLVGSAQLRRKGAVLQHGSLPLFGDVAHICDALGYPDEGTRARSKIKVRERAATLQDALGGQVISWEQAAEAVVSGFMDVFGLDFAQDTLSWDEMTQAAQLEHDIYRTSEWTRRV